MTTFIDVHVIQTVPPSNLNRDDAGSPKTATYGGSRRARVSSQSWKRATRRGFNAKLSASDGSTRTKRVSGLIADRIKARHEHVSKEDALRIANSMLGRMGLSRKKNDAEIDYLMFLGHGQVDALVETIEDVDALIALGDKELADAFDKGTIEASLTGGHPIDVGLFGRMVADISNLRVDAACQVAHAISTHAVENEFDYFTAVDDEKPADESSGAAHIGTTEFNSATLYRYANVSLDGLVANLDGDRARAIDGIRAFIDAFTLEMPTGKQNSFANRTIPAAVVVTVRDSAPVNAVTAFERPLLSRDGSGYSHEAVAKLAAELATAERLWVDPPTLTVATYDAEPIEQFGASVPFRDLLDQVVAHLSADSQVRA